MNDKVYRIVFFNLNAWKDEKYLNNTGFDSDSADKEIELLKKAETKKVTSGIGRDRINFRKEEIKIKQ